MNRFYCSSADVSGDSIIIRDKEQVHHIKDVIRLTEGEQAVVFDDRANEFDCRISRIDAAQVIFAIRNKKDAAVCSRPTITVACAIPKHSKIDDIIDRLTQLGVDRIVPLMTERVIVRMDKDKRSGRQQRWQKIALAASKQSQRNTVPIVDEVTDMPDLIAASNEFDLKMIPTLDGERKTLKQTLSKKNHKSIIVLIGPEGDFSPAEIGLAIRAGFVPVTFGGQVLRVETAALFVASILHYEYA
jgi:16S rRNA (uracil1498-N3)-methyltransferase